MLKNIMIRNKYYFLISQIFLYLLFIITLNNKYMFLVILIITYFFYILTETIQTWLKNSSNTLSLIFTIFIILYLVTIFIVFYTSIFILLDVTSNKFQIFISLETFIYSILLYFNNV